MLLASCTPAPCPIPLSLSCNFCSSCLVLSALLVAQRACYVKCRVICSQFSTILLLHLHPLGASFPFSSVCCPVLPCTAWMFAYRQSPT